MEKNKIEEMIIESLKETAGLIKEGTCSSKIIIPDYRTRKNIKEEDVKEGDEKEKRYSEQELKQIFLNRIENNPSVLYSVETPSKARYNFSEKKKPKVLFGDEHSEDNFLSSRIDVSLYNTKRELCSHIEFKYGQCEKDAIQKDFLKLICESMDGIGNYFVQYLSSKRPQTKYAIFNKYIESLKSIKDNNADSEKNQKIDDIDQKMKTVFVYVMFVGLKPEDGYEIYKISMKELDKFDLQENNVENCLEKYKFPRNDA